MEIQYIHLAGFKRDPVETDIYLSSKHRDILERQGNDLHYYLNVILGIIFGFDEIEKQEYRDSEGSNIFTGLIRLRCNDQTLIIERDFETDILACMLDFRGSSKVVFHDRDFVDNGPERSYLSFLRTYFLFEDKNIVRQLIFLLIDISDPTLEEVLKNFYMLCSPKIQLQSFKQSFKEYNDLLELKTEPATTGINKDLLRFENRKQKIRSSLKIEKQLQELNETNKKWEILHSRILEKQNELLQLQEILKQKFPLLKDHDGTKLRKDILIWKELIAQKADYDKKFNTLQSKIDKIEKILNSELLLYRSIPTNFENNIEQYHQQSQKLKTNLSTLEKIKERIESIERTFKKRRKIIFYLAVLLPILSGIVAYFMFHLSIPVSVFILLGVTIALAAFYASLLTRYKSNLWIQNFEESRIMNENTAIEQWLNHLRSKSILIEDYANKNIHIKRYHRARELNRRLENLRAEQASFAESWKSHDGFKKVREFNKIYGKIIDLNREDLNQYLENFEELKQLISTYQHYDNHLSKKINRYRKAFQLAYDKLSALHLRLIESAQIRKEGQSAKALLDKIEEDISRLKGDSDTKA